MLQESDRSCVKVRTRRKAPSRHEEQHGRGNEKLKIMSARRDAITQKTELPDKRKVA